MALNGLCRLVSSSRVLSSSNVTLSFFKLQNKTKKALIPEFSCKRIILPQLVSVKAMASEREKQHAQPGKEHVMDPTPQFSSPDYKPSNKLRGKVALITGGDSGIGRAVSYCFALQGATVAFTYVKGQEDKDAQETLQILKEAKSSDA
ncbi:NADPH-dependent aldehyde reductase 1 [Cardamine amara subsp. amara]|uniref:NADPH-dependent aldehyde reductase 1 n=1 Tax=Cardamine amara subsp. amara TaxID=228776 RepID=A0ABD0Z0A1_CARAN